MKKKDDEAVWHLVTATLLSRLAKKGETVEIPVAEIETLLAQWPEGVTVMVVEDKDCLRIRLTSHEEGDAFKSSLFTPGHA